MRPLLFCLLLTLGTGAIAQQAPQSAAGHTLPLDKEFHRQRREAMRKMLPARSVAVFFANPVRNRANDVDYPYHPDPDLFYLTGLEEPDAVLLLFKEPRQVAGGTATTEALFVRPRNELAELWTGSRLGPEAAAQQLGVARVLPNTAFRTTSLPWGEFERILFLPFQNDVRNAEEDPADLYDLMAAFRKAAAIPADYNPDRVALYRRLKAAASEAESKQLLAQFPEQSPLMQQDEHLQRYLAAKNWQQRQAVAASLPTGNFDSDGLDLALHELREIKTPQELQLLRRACAVSAIGQVEVMKAMHPDFSETETQGLHEYVYRKYGCKFEGYPSIVGAGNNSCVLHYTENDKPRIGNDLILMDCGAEYGGYTADVTRTIPANGKFSPEQKQIYELVLAAQDAGIAACKVGNPFGATHQAAQQVIAKGLVKLGIIKNEKDARMYFPHGTSHYLGLDVHDRGTYGPFRANTVITVEPGIYIPEGSPCDKKWWGIGVRIEDDILITENGPENLSRQAPRTIAEIEATMAQPSPLDNFKLPELK